MSKANRKYIIALSICFTGLILLQWLSPKPINWKLSYMKKDKIPYGTSALNDVLQEIFPGQKISTQNVPIYNALNGNEINNCNYIIINQTFQPDKLDTRELLNFVGKGNFQSINNNAEGKFELDPLLKCDLVSKDTIK